MVSGSGNVIICNVCEKEKFHMARGMCNACYLRWWKKKNHPDRYLSKKTAICELCKIEKVIVAKMKCNSCYLKFWKKQNNYPKNNTQKYNHRAYWKKWNIKNNYGLSLIEYKQLTKKCIICGFNKIVHLHHIDGNKKNYNKENFIGLCPNHHMMAHHYKWKLKINNLIYRYQKERK